MESWPPIYLPPIEAPVPALNLKLTEGSLANSKEFKIYVCGITPYDATHLGHALTYIYFDLINRYQVIAGKKLKFSENVTDVDDPLFERARRDNILWSDLAKEQTSLFQRDMTALRVIPPASLDLVSETVNLVLDGLKKLSEKGLIYQLDTDVYFDSSSYLASLPVPLEEAIHIFAERGGDPDRIGKRNRLDPLVWKKNCADEPGWASPFGTGRPGWHIECAVIAANAMRNFGGDDFVLDLQGGGSDLIFPHHFMTKIIAESIFDKRFASSFAHTALLGLDGEKMSKSKGNLRFVSRLLAEGWDAMEIRYALINRDFQRESMWDDGDLIKARSSLEKLRLALSRENCADSSDVIQKVLKSLADNMNTPKALEELGIWADKTIIYGGESSPGEIARFIDAVLGIAL